MTSRAVLLRFACGALVVSLAPRVFAGQAPPAAVDPALETAVRQYFATQEAEDAAAYLALWAPDRRPRRELLQFVFDSGDDVYSEIAIGRITQSGGETRVRVSATRDRTSTNAQGPASTRRSRMDVSLVFQRDGDAWRLIREAPPTDDLAAAILEAASAAERDRLLLEHPQLVDRRLIDALSRRGGELAQAQKLAEARVVYERTLDVARHLSDRAAEGEALQNVGNASYFLRDFPRALEAYEQRLAIERARQDRAGVAAALGGIGTIGYSYADYTAALAAYAEALGVLETLPDQSAVASTLISTGNVRYLLGDYPAAASDYVRSRALAQAMGNRSGESDALSGLGRVYVAQGDYASALEVFNAVLSEGRARASHPAQGTALMNIGDIHFRLANLDAARGALDESRSHFAAMSDPANVGRAFQGLGLVELAAGRFPVSEQHYGRSISACRPAGDAECVAAAQVGLAFAQSSQDKFAEAADSYRAAIEAFTSLRRAEPAARAEIGLAQALTGLGRYEEALAAAGRARHAGLALEIDDVLWRAMVAAARAHRKAGAADRALGVARAAIYPVDDMREAARLRPGSPLPRDTGTAFATLALLQAESGDAAAAFDTSERMRVHDLRAALVGYEREIARGTTPEERAAERDGAAAIASLRAQVARERQLPRPDQARIAAFEERLAGAIASRTAQQERLFERLPALRRWRGMFEPARTPDLAALLATDDTLLIDLVVSDDGLLVLAAWLEEGAVKLVARVTPLSRREVAEAVGRMLQPNILKDAALWRAESAALAAAFPSEVAARGARARRLLVLPHETLWRVPFEALAPGGQEIGASAEVVYIASVSATTGITAVDRPAGTLVLAAGAPDLSPALAAQVAQTAPGWTIRPAAGVRPELDKAAGTGAAAATTVLTGPEATETTLRRALPEAGVIHLANPFRVNAASPLFSPILLTADAPASVSGPGAPTVAAAADGVLDLREVMNLDLRAGSVVLSDPGALSMRDAADDVALVQWAWWAAGVPSIALTRWASGGDGQELFIRELHAQLRAGRGLAAAAYSARRAVRRTTGHAAPFHWAGWLIAAGR